MNNSILLSTIYIIIALICAPLLTGIIVKTKAFFAGRKGASIFQLYFDILKLLRKDKVYSSTTTFIFILGPIISISAILISIFFIPFFCSKPLISFDGDLFLIVYLFALARFFMVLSALDTGSSFEGMGSSREIFFSIFAEIAFIISLITLARSSGSFSLYEIISGVQNFHPEVLLASFALGIVYLCENSRIPFDDPTTHLELTMIHEVMILDHSAFELALYEYAASLKLWITGAIIVSVIISFFSNQLSFAMQIIFGLIGMSVLAILTGIIESTTARLRLLRVPNLLIIACVVALFSFIVALN